jgi:hypothetical protein
MMAVLTFAALLGASAPGPTLTMSGGETGGNLALLLWGATGGLMLGCVVLLVENYILSPSCTSGGSDGGCDGRTPALEAGGTPTDATLARLIRFGQWALDEAAQDLSSHDGISDERLEELGTGLEQLARVILQRVRWNPHEHSGVEHGAQATTVDGELETETMSILCPHCPPTPGTLPSIMSAVGVELRRIRDERGWTRDGVMERTELDLSAQALANYEYGIRPISVPVFIEICDALGVSAIEVLGLVLRRCRRKVT